MSSENLSIEKTGGVTVISLAGRYNLHIAPDLDDALDAATEKDQARVLVDMAQLLSIDSTIIGLLFGFQSRLRRGGGELSICSIPGHLQDTFDILVVGEFIPIYADRASALQAIAAEGGTTK